MYTKQYTAVVEICGESEEDVIKNTGALLDVLRNYSSVNPSIGFRVVQLEEQEGRTIDGGFY